MVSPKKQLFHLICTTFGEYPVWDKQGDWEKLKALYAVLEQREIQWCFSKELPPVYSGKKKHPERVLFNAEAKEKITAEVMELCQKDRLLEGISLEMIRVSDSYMELLVYTHPDALIQQVSRLKSRTATLLSFHFPLVFKGKGTWGKGTWYAEILNKKVLAASIISQ